MQDLQCLQLFILLRIHNLFRDDPAKRRVFAISSRVFATIRQGRQERSTRKAKRVGKKRRADVLRASGLWLKSI
jgi:hypothetical protein